MWIAQAACGIFFGRILSYYWIHRPAEEGYTFIDAIVRIPDSPGLFAFVGVAFAGLVLMLRSGTRFRLLSAGGDEGIL
jgi:hypothetical protein